MRTMSRPAQLETITALSYAVAAYRLNNNLYVKSADYYTGMKVNEFEVRPNRTIMQELVANPEFVPDDSDIAAATEMREHFKGYFLAQLMNGGKDDFSKKILELITQDAIAYRDTGLLCYLPTKFAVDVKRDTLAERLRNADSNYVGTLGQKIELDIEVLDVKFYALYNSYMMKALSGENIITFYSKDKFEGKNLKVRARVKSHSKDKYGNLATQLNYVKLV